MKNYIIHIGLPKTGTTALQNTYFSRINQSSVCYNPSLIIQSLTEILKLIDFEIATKADIQLLKDVVSAQEIKIPQNNILISHEILSQRLGKFDYHKRGELLKSIFPNATIVLVLRYQPDLLCSLYLQFLRQNYLLKHTDVFVPFAKHTFSISEQWKANMLIDVKQWDYTAFVKYFKSLYGKKVYVFFYENFPNLIDLGKEIISLGNIEVNIKTLDFLPRINISYNVKIVQLIFFICRLKLAFNSNRGINSKHIKDLMEQANQARFAFDADGVDDFLFRVKNPYHIPKNSYNLLDDTLFKVLTKFQNISVFFRYAEYQLPAFIMNQLEYDAKAMNASLHETIDDQSIPKHYV